MSCLDMEEPKESELTDTLGSSSSPILCKPELNLHTLTASPQIQEQVRLPTGATGRMDPRILIRQAPVHNHEAGINGLAMGPQSQDSTISTSAWEAFSQYRDTLHRRAQSLSSGAPSRRQSFQPRSRQWGSSNFRTTRMRTGGYSRPRSMGMYRARPMRRFR